MAGVGEEGILLGHDRREIAVRKFERCGFLNHGLLELVLILTATRIKILSGEREIDKD